MALNNTEKNLAYCILFGAGLFVALLFFSFEMLNTDQFGLNMSDISMRLENTTYGPGWHFIGVGHRFIKFPKTVKTIEFSSTTSANLPNLLSRTNDGLEVQIEVSFQYMLDSTRLYDLYLSFSTDYEVIFERYAIDLLTSAVIFEIL